MDDPASYTQNDPEHAKTQGAIDGPPANECFYDLTADRPIVSLNGHPEPSESDEVHLIVHPGYVIREDHLYERNGTSDLERYVNYQNRLGFEISQADGPVYLIYGHSGKEGVLEFMERVHGIEEDEFAGAFQTYRNAEIKDLERLREEIGPHLKDGAEVLIDGEYKYRCVKTVRKQAMISGLNRHNVEISDNVTFEASKEDPRGNTESDSQNNILGLASDRIYEQARKASNIVPGI